MRHASDKTFKIGPESQQACPLNKASVVECVVLIYGGPVLSKRSTRSALTQRPNVSTMNDPSRNPTQHPMINPGSASTSQIQQGTCEADKHKLDSHQDFGFSMRRWLQQDIKQEPFVAVVANPRGDYRNRR